ncbi:hypothetical protein CONPUDRAFT_163685 [Coniophora puteana RWD-64-598 SS2]|uniref:Zn(2)-C6 fungal-type domain-containing protein n=1 Tax=Coniophora puteana (strain RWD-64-598) TaxID=741705 RepID=A0A5M3MZZ7_CONPW|nr:uncharacterized protein CONPUDRAFT_163685 [Coniophora puteana RWD-64-598 SS2]EIW84606.1 hypothetical protein CONPUDRAFT_163685 [Coniophora puteana RWD-64-598 SS2]
MSTGEDAYTANSRTGFKKPRLQRACDVCRRRKNRCDGDRLSGRKCTVCSTNDFECTYVEAGKIRRISREYVESLEKRLEQMERLFSQFCPDVNIAELLLKEGDNNDAPTRHDASHSSSSALASHMLYRSPTLGSGNQTPTPEEPVSSDEEVDMLELKLSESIRKMTIDPTRHRFFGKSSGITLIQQALDLKNEHTGDQAENMLDIFYRDVPKSVGIHQCDTQGNRGENPPYIFPEPDLSRKLIDLYFIHNNPMVPLLHRPTFERKYADGSHLRNTAFGAVVLLVCAVAAPGCDDPRVRPPGAPTEYSAGWQYFDQVQIMKKALLAPPCLEDMQMYCLSAIYVQGTRTPQACWTIVGIGIRLALEVGAHRQKVYNRKPTVEDELWKRAFWVLVSLDRAYSSSLGRPCAIHDTDFDLDLPTVCDDEYWEHQDPEQQFKQPPGTPSYVAYFVSALKLSQILAFALRTIYSIKRSKVLLGFVGHKWEQHIVAELDSALNEWIDSVPEHIRWNPNIQDPTFLLQSCALYASYYHTQIIVHRPFIPSPRKPSPLSYPSLAICTNAARSCSHVIDTCAQRADTDRPFVPAGIQAAAIMAGIILLVNIWGGKRTGLIIHPEKEMADVHKCMAMLKLYERRYPWARKGWDVLYKLASVGKLPLPQARPARTGKREREEDAPSTISVPQIGQPESRPRDIAGPSRLAGDGSAQHLLPQGIQTPPVLMNQPSQTTCSQMQSQQQTRQHFAQPPTHGPMGSDSAASSVLQRPQPQLDLHLDGSDPFRVWPSGEVSGLDLSSIMMAYDSLYAGAVEAGGSSTHDLNAGDATSANEAPHTPNGIDDFLLQLMRQPQPQKPLASGADGSAVGGYESVGMNRAMEASQSMSSDDMMSIWSNAPDGFEVDNWSAYLRSVSGTNYNDGTQPWQQQDGES